MGATSRVYQQQHLTTNLVEAWGPVHLDKAALDISYETSEAPHASLHPYASFIFFKATPANEVDIVPR
jgi:hypothetical protein